MLVLSKGGGCRDGDYSWDWWGFVGSICGSIESFLILYCII